MHMKNKSGKYWWYISTIVFMYLFMLTGTSSFSQGTKTPLQIKGTITDAISGVPLAGATIIATGNSKGTLSDDKGAFSITAASDAILQISFTGYLSQSIPVNGKSNIPVLLIQDVAKLNEVVVVGYGTQKKGEVTSAIASLKEVDFNKGNIIDPIGLIQGKVAGLNVVNPEGGDPNGRLQIQLRGTTTLSGGTSPLVIIDGVLGGDLNSVNVNEIESIDVLKDGSAAAIYGTRGTNGVIIITTKKAKAGTHSIEVNSYVSTQTISKKLENLTAQQFRELLPKIYPGQESQYDHGASTNWFDEITHTPLDQYHNISLAGGTDKFSYRAALNYRQSQGIVKKNDNNRLQSRLAVTQKEFDNRLIIDYNVTYAYTKRQYADKWALQQAFRYNPTEPVYDPANTFAGGYYRNAGPFEYYNPVAMINEKTNEGTEEVFTGSVNAKYYLLRELSLNAMASAIRGTAESGSYQTRYYPIGLGINGYGSKGASSYTNKLLELSTEYKKSFSMHNVQAIAGYSYQDGINENLSAANQNFDTDIFGYNNLGAGYGLSTGNASMGSYKGSNKLIAFFGRATYNFNEKYLFTTSARYEGSSRFGKNYKWGLFPSVSAGWRISKEKFLADSRWLSDLKLRVGYGVTGNQDIANYLSLQLLTTGGRFLYNGQWVTTYPPASNPNPDLKWERKGELNAGFDYALLKGLLYGSVDYYVRNTSDLLWTYSVPVPPNVYDRLYTNVGKMRNNGLEVTINANLLEHKSFSWTSGLIFSTNQNKLVSFSDTSRGYQLTDLKTGWLGADLQTWTHQVVEGGKIGNFVAVVFLGIDEDGNSIFLDKNKDGIINDEDREVVGNAYPKFMLNFNNTFRYKNFDLSIFLRGVFGNDVLNMHRMYYENFAYFGGKNILASALDHSEFKGKAEYSSRFVEKASYIKLDNIALGYNFNVKDSRVFKNIRLYITGQQLFTITKYKGVDPEITLYGLNPGVDDYSYYPRTSRYTLGVNVTF